MVTISGLIVLTSAVVGTFLFSQMKNEMKHELLNWGETTVRQVANSCEYGVLTENSAELNSILEGLIVQDVFVYAAVQDSAGEILAQFDLLDAANLVTWIAKRDFSKQYQSDTTHISYWSIPENEIDIADFSFPVRTVTFDIALEDLGVTVVENKTHDVAYEKIGLIRIGFSLQEMNNRIYAAARLISIITLLVAIAVIALTAVLVNMIIKPIDILAGATERISKGDLSQFVEESSIDELRKLAKAFNVMVESLRESRDEVEMYNRTLELKITERTRELEEAQTQLVQSEKMSAIGQLAAGVAHELNNPMGGILGYAQFALEKMSKVTSGDLTEKDIKSQIKYLTDIEQQARRCRGIVRNLLRFSRSSDKKEWEEFDLNVMLLDTISLIQHQLDLSNIEMEKVFADDLPLYHGNASQLQQVFTNLLLNAQHAMPDGGRITLTTRLLPKLGEFSGCVEVVVEDNGSGIEAESLNRVFEPFFTTKESGKGTGLGLSVSFGIVKEHGGDITVSSELGGGTRFTVILPLDNTSTGSTGKIKQVFGGEIESKQ
jgi:two-component system NtrC family sensor kinase